MAEEIDWDSFHDRDCPTVFHGSPHCNCHVVEMKRVQAERDRYKAALETIASIGPNDFAANGALILISAVGVAKKALKSGDAQD